MELIINKKDLDIAFKYHKIKNTVQHDILAGYIQSERFITYCSELLRYRAEPPNNFNKILKVVVKALSKDKPIIKIKIRTRFVTKFIIAKQNGVS